MKLLHSSGFKNIFADVATQTEKKLIERKLGHSLERCDDISSKRDFANHFFAEAMQRPRSFSTLNPGHGVIRLG